MAKAQPWPKEPGACVDLLYKTREARLALERQAEELKSKETALKEHLLETCGKAKLTGLRGKIASLGVGQQVVAKAVDWEKTWPWIAKNKAWDLVQRRVNDEAFRERLEAGVRIPGLEPFHKTTFSINKISNTNTKGKAK